MKTLLYILLGIVGMILLVIRNKKDVFIVKVFGILFLLIFIIMLILISLSIIFQ